MPKSYCPPLKPEDYELYYRHTLSQVDLAWLSSKKVRYVITSDAMSARFTRFPKEFPKEAAFYSSLEKNAVLIKSFEPAWDEYKNDPALTDLHNPTIAIYRMTNSPASSSRFPPGFLPAVKE
jgi:hypothetical protein